MPAWEDVSPFTEQRTRARRFSWTNLLIILNLAGFVATGFLSRSNQALLSYVEFDKTTAIGQLQLWQFVTYSFVQLMDGVYIPWLILGVYFLFTIGNELEAELGPARYLALYFGAAAYGAVAHALTQYFVPVFAPEPNLGRASTFCAPVLGVAVTAAITWPRRPVLFLFFLPLRLRTAVTGLSLFWLGCTLLPAPWFRLGPGSSMGAVVTALLLASLEPRLNRAFDRAALRRDRDRFLEEVDVRRRTDGILDKITREGMASLTRSERRILKQASQILNRGKARPHE